MKKGWFILLFIFLFLFGNIVSASFDEIPRNINSSENNSLIRVVIYKNVSSGSGLKISNLNHEDFELPKGQIKYNNEKRTVAFVSLKELEDLRNNNKVLSVEEEIPLHALLNEATVIQRAVSTWDVKVSGENLTGSGQTVCIIDTGVDYTHPDLGGCYGENNVSSSCKVVGGYDFVNNDDDPMDDYGHGTHVSGIISANGSIEGMAPNTRIIMIKSGDSSGNFYPTDVEAGLRWCIDNSTMFNITVISMSFGGTNYYSTNCDSINSDMTDLVNEATSDGISVVIASGNNYTHFPLGISYPACISSAIPVSAVDKSDALASYANRNSLVRLLGIGSSVNSTRLGGGYLLMSGTSMATPMVAGAIAILKQYFNLSGLTKTPAEIENLLYETGKVISENGINYSRIDLYSAISEMSNLSINQTSPSNDTYTNIANTNFTCFANSSILDLVNMTFYFYNSTGDLLSTLNESISGTDNSSTLNYTLPYDDIYSWGCKAYTENSASATSDNRTITYDSTLPTVNLSNETLFSTIDISFNTSEAVNYTLNYSGEFENSSSYTNSSTINLNGLNSSTEYVMNLTFCDRAGNCNFTEFNLTTLPIFVNLTSPFNISYTNVNDTNFTCEINSTDSANLTNVTFFLYNSTGDLIYNSTNILDGFYNLSIFNYTLENESNYSWTCVAYNNISESYSPVNYTVFYDVTSPSVNLTNPNASFSYLILNLSEETNYSVTGSITNSSSNYNSSYVIPFDGSCGAKTYSLTFCDRAGNCNTTSQSFTASVCPSIPGGGSPRSSASNYREPEEGTESNPIVLEDIGSISRKTLTLNKPFYFEVGNNETHNITLTHITNEYVIIEIHSKYVSLNLTENSSQKVDIDSDDNYDLEVLVGKITNTTVDITLKKIEFAKEKDKILSNQTEESNDNLNNSVKNHTWIYFVIGGILLIILIYFIFYHNKLSLRIKELRLNKLHTKNHSENSEE